MVAPPQAGVQAPGALQSTAGVHTPLPSHIPWVQFDAEPQVAVSGRSHEVGAFVVGTQLPAAAQANVITDRVPVHAPVPLRVQMPGSGESQTKPMRSQGTVAPVLQTPAAQTGAVARPMQTFSDAPSSMHAPIAPHDVALGIRQVSLSVSSAVWQAPVMHVRTVAVRDRVPMQSVADERVHSDHGPSVLPMPQDVPFITLQEREVFVMTGAQAPPPQVGVEITPASVPPHVFAVRVQTPLQVVFAAPQVVPFATVHGREVFVLTDAQLPPPQVGAEMTPASVPPHVLAVCVQIPLQFVLLDPQDRPLDSCTQSVALCSIAVLLRQTAATKGSVWPSSHAQSVRVRSAATVCAQVSSS